MDPCWRARAPLCRTGIRVTSVLLQGSPSLVDYSSTKGAIVSFVRSLALQLLEKGIRVNAVAPGDDPCSMLGLGCMWLASQECQLLGKGGSQWLSGAACDGDIGQTVCTIDCTLVLDFECLPGAIVGCNG